MSATIINIADRRRDEPLQALLSQPSDVLYATGDTAAPGQFVKVHLPGECVWAIVQSVLAGGSITAKIDNDTVSSLHPYRFGQLVTAQYSDGGWRAYEDTAPAEYVAPEKDEA